MGLPDRLHAGAGGGAVPRRSGMGSAAWALPMASTFATTSGGKGATFGPLMSMWSDKVSDVAASQPSA